MQLRASGKLVAELLKYLTQQVKPGVTSNYVDSLAAKWIEEHKCQPAFFNYRGFPKTICISVNDEIVHGIPSDREFKLGDVVSLDVGLFYNGWAGDTATTIYLGDDISPELAKFLKVSNGALGLAIGKAKAGNFLGDVSEMMQKVELLGYNVIKEYGGHGIGRALHEEPFIPCYREPKSEGLKLQSGMVLALEIMTTMGSPKIKHGEDKWTVSTADKSLSAHFEHMVLINEDGWPEVLTV